MKSIFALIIFISCLEFSAFGQRVNYENNYNWYLGFNTGAAWQTTDIDNKTKLGWGFTIGKSVWMDFGRPVSVDIRGRYLRGFWEGIDKDTTVGFTNNLTVDSLYNGGGVKRNFLSEQHRIALEIVLHANNFRERTNLDPYVFLGLGITGHNAFGDYITYDKDNGFVDQSYDFSTGDNIDRVYEFPMANGSNSLYEEEKLQWDFMPSLGVGLGYYVTPFVSVGLEHKTTFTLNDYYDGLEENGNNDLYHYTNGYVRFYLGGKKKDLTSSRPVDPVPVQDPVVNNPNTGNNEGTTQPRTPTPPVVTYTRPTSSPYITQVSTYNLGATVTNVSGSENIIFRQNGIVSTDFNYSASTDVFSSNVTLSPGQNVFVITGTNEDGDDAETMIINYERETVTPPVVNITHPASNPETVTTENFNLTANVLNVSGKPQINLTVNGNAITAYNYSTNTSALSYSFSLRPGANTVSITGTNSAGTDSETATILYRPGNTVQPPVVNFTNPSYSPFNTSDANFNLNANVLNVANASQLTFKQNGTVNTNFSFNGTSFSSNVVLIPGQNVFELIGTNTAGQDNASTIIVYNRPAPKPPVVTITNPFNSPVTTSNNTASIIATVLNVNGTNQITMLVNGNTFTNFNFNVQTSNLTANLSLQQGSNVVSITGTNNDGTDSKQTIIIYTPAQTVQPPVVDFTLPTTNPFNTTAASQMINANVFNVANKNQINVLVNGRSVSNFTFNANTHVLGLNTNLIQGANIITITATNEAGVDSDNQTIIRNEPEPQYPPVVTFLNPVNDPLTVYTPNYNVQAKVEHVAGVQNIDLFINGISSTNFSYSASRQIMTFSTGLVNGANNIQITGTNNYGQDVAFTTIIYKRQVTTQPPVVEITTPGPTSTISTQQNFSLEADVLNVSNANQITLTINGNNVGGFIYNANTHNLNYTGNLIAGLNTVVITATNTAGTDSDNAFINYRPQEVIQPPLVSFLQPGSNGTTVGFPGYQMKAKVLHVNSKAGVLVKLNGQIVNPAYYTFNATNKEVRYAATLKAGNNIFEVTGTNTAGNHSASAIINYRTSIIELPCSPPNGIIHLPVINNKTTETQLLKFKAQVIHVRSSNEISLKVNGSNQPFSFNSTTKLVNKDIRLNEGNNVIELKLETRCGKKTLTRTIIYKNAEESCDEPIINAILPALNFTTELNTIPFKASFSNIRVSEQISVTVNGKLYPFSFDNAQHILNTNIELKLGINKIVMTATNQCGSYELVWMVERKPCEKPLISVKTDPLNNVTLSTPNLNIVGSITHLDKRESVTVTQNGRAINFVYDHKTESFSTSTVLQPGINLFVISASSACGKTIKSIKVNYKPVATIKAPTVKITSPTTSPTTTEANTYLIKATTTNVSNANQISATINGTNINFNFNAITQQITFNQNLVDGNNTILITVVNTAGTDYDTKTIIHTAPEKINPPVITIISPTANPHLTNENGRVLVTGNITNISNASQVQVLFNGNTYEGNNPTISNDVYNFRFYVSVTDNRPATTVTFIATNTAGTDNVNQVIQKRTNNTGGGIITIGGSKLGRRN